MQNDLLHFPLIFFAKTYFKITSGLRKVTFSFKLDTSAYCVFNDEQISRLTGGLTRRHSLNVNLSTRFSRFQSKIPGMMILVTLNF